MGLKSILTVATNLEDVAHLDAAVTLARAEDAHLDVLCLGVDRANGGYYYVGGAPVAPVILQEAIERADEEARAIEAAVRHRLMPEDIRWAIDTAVAQMGVIGPQVGQLARFCDLVIVAKPYGKGASPDGEAVIEAALFEGRAPVLMLPLQGQAKPFGKRIVIGWNQSDEAMAAVRAALPFLKRAARVDVAVVGPAAHGPERSDPGGMLSQYLARHGVKAEVSVLARTLPRVCEVLLRHGEDIGADMLVIGAYGHSRLREAILGGATRDLLELSPLPVFAAR